MPARHVAVRLAAVVLVASLAGCTDDAPRPDPTPDVSDPTATTSADLTTRIPQRRALSELDVDGADGTTVTWRLPGDVAPNDPVGVAQRYLAVFALAGTPGTDPPLELVASIADGGAAAMAQGRLLDPAEYGVRTGPLWVWLDQAEERGDRAVVRGCADVGYFQPPGTATPVRDRAEAWYTELSRVEDVDGREVWKVTRHNTGPVRESNAFEGRCPAWSVHRP